MHRVHEHIPLEECIRRAVAYGRGRALLRASCFASAIWPGVFFTAQGAGAAASRILKVMEKRGLARWVSTGKDWGWVVDGGAV